MEELKLNRISSGDSQDDFVNKINQNFVFLDSFYGGPSGKMGNEGKVGPMGKRGRIGPIGLRGPRGSVWTFDSINPATGASTSSVGDYWVDISDKNKVYQLSSNRVWVYENLELKASQQFKKLSNVDGPSVKNAMVQSSTNPETNTFVLNSIPSDKDKLNPQYTRVVVETNAGKTTPFYQPTQPLMEFAKSATGATGDYAKSVVWTWGGTGTSQYDLVLDVRQGGMDFNLGKNLKLRSNTSEVVLESHRDSVYLAASEINITASSDFYMEDFASSGVIRIDSPVFKTGQGDDRDLSVINTPVSISKKVSGFAESAFVVENDASSRGDGIHIEAEYNSGDGLLWRSKFDDTDFLRVNKRGELKIARKIGLANHGGSPVTPGPNATYDSVDIHWFGLFPSAATGSGTYGSGEISWDGDEEVLINTASGNELGVYINTYWYHTLHMDEGESFSVRVTMDDVNNKIRAVGLGSYNGGLYYPSNSYASQYRVFVNPVASVDFHFVKDAGSSATGGYSLYYEAHGGTAAFGGTGESGVLYSG